MAKVSANNQLPIDGLNYHQAVYGAVANGTVYWARLLFTAEAPCRVSISNRYQITVTPSSPVLLESPNQDDYGIFTEVNADGAVVWSATQLLGDALVSSGASVWIVGYGECL